MKPLSKHILLVTILIVSFFNCSKDDDDDLQNHEPTTQELLIGKWHYSIIATGEATACESKTFFNFLDSENIIYQFIQDDSIINPADGEVIGDCFYAPETTSTYTLHNNQDINIVNPYGIFSLKIVSISDTTLVTTRSGLTGVETIVLTKEL